MRKLFILPILMLLILGLASAISFCEEEATAIGGTIYQGDVTNGVSGADVEVICTHNGTDYIETTTSLSHGEYAVLFEEDECDYGDSVTVNAEKSGLEGENAGSVTMTYDLCCLTLNVGIVDVPLVPEFGLLIGGLTLVSAIGVFFFIRRK